MPKEVTEKKTDDDDVLKSIQLLRDDAKGAYASFAKKLSAGPIDVQALAIELQDLFSLQADLAALTFQAHYESFEWQGEVDSELDELKEGLAGTSILPEDAARLKATILSLQQNLREPTSPNDEALTALKARAAEAIAFIDEATIDEGDEDEDDETDDATTETN